MFFDNNNSESGIEAPMNLMSVFSLRRATVKPRVKPWSHSNDRKTSSKLVFLSLYFSFFRWDGTRRKAHVKDESGQCGNSVTGDLLTHEIIGEIESWMTVNRVITAWEEDSPISDKALGFLPTIIAFNCTIQTFFNEKLVNHSQNSNRVVRTQDFSFSFRFPPGFRLQSRIRS